MQGYQKRSGTINLGDEYEHLIPALFALRTIGRADIVNMWLASNADGMGAFDDVVFYVEFQDGQRKAYVLQLKHKGCAITATSFSSNSGSDDYSIIKYQNSFEEIMQNTKTKSMLDNIDIENVTFILYTIGDLAQSIDKEVMNKLNLILYTHDVHQNELSLLNTSISNNCVYKFKMEDETKGGYNKTFLSQFYFYINQAPAMMVEDLIQQIISETFANSDTNIKLNLLNFIKMWVRGDLGGHYKLRKNEFQLKLTELLLNAYLVVPKSFAVFKKTDLLHAVVKTSEITIVQNYTDETISVLWSTIKSILYKHTDRQLKDGSCWENTLELKFADLPKKFKKQELLQYLTLKQVGTNRQLTMKCLYIILWKASLVPLLVKAEDMIEAKNIFSTLTILNDQEFKRHVILLLKGEDYIWTTHHPNQSILQTLADIKDVNLIKTVLDNLQISLQGREPIALSTILTKDSEILNKITIELLLKMLHQPLNVGTKYEDLPEHYIKRNVSRNVLTKHVLWNAGDVFVVNGPGDIINDIKELTNPLRVIDGKHYFKEISTMHTEEIGNVVVLQGLTELPLKVRIHIATRNCNVHYLRYYNGYLEWSRSVGNLAVIRKYLIKVSSAIKEEHMLQHFSSNINIISSNSGMGKSVMMKYLAKSCMKDYWVHTILLNNCQPRFTLQDNPSFDNFVGTDLSEDTPSVQKIFSTSIIATLREQKKVCVLMDAFDEISSEYVNSIIHLAKKYQDLGYRLWITTRPSHSDFLETKLNTISISLNPFSINDQTIYLTKLLYKKKQHNIDVFVKKLQHLLLTSLSNWDAEFFSVPLHLQMLAVVFEDKNIADLTVLDNISSVDLYTAFIDKKFDVYWKKMFGNNINGLNEKLYDKLLKQLKNQHLKASLLLFFPKRALIEIIDLIEIEDFLKDPLTGDFGIIIPGRDWEKPIFTHRSFAEFLAATFLATNCQKEQVRPLLVALFEEELTFVRQLFDRILAKGHPLHLAVLNKNLCEVNTLIEKRKGDSMLDYDLGGRTALHLAAAQGSRHRFPKDGTIVSPHDYNVILEPTNHKVSLVDGNILKILENVWNSQEIDNHRDNILGWSAVDYSCHSYSLDVLEIIFSNNDSETILNFFSKISLIYYCVKYGYKNLLERITIEDMFITMFPKNSLICVAVENPDINILDTLFKKCTASTMIRYLHYKDMAGDLPIMRSAVSGNLKVLKILLKYEVGLNTSNSHGLTVLLILVFYDHLECLKHLVTCSSIDLNVRTAAHRKRDHTFNNPGHTALYFAIHKNNLEMTKLLIEHGTNVHLKYENERTVLHVASINGFTDAIQVLVDSGSEIHSVDENGRTALHYASQNIKINSINMLLKLGADINITDIFGLTPLHYAIQNFSLTEIKLPQGFKFHMKDKFGRTFIHYAAQKITIQERIKFLLPIGKYINQWHHYGTTPAYRATTDVRLANIDFLVQSGLNPNEGDSNGITPLHYASEQAIFENIERLLKLGANINKADKFGQTPLFQVTQRGSLDTIKFLMQFSPDINKHNSNKVAPIHVAAEKKFNKCVMLLLENGANINLCTSDGCTPLFIAVRKNNLQLVRLLLQNEANVNKPSRDTFIDGNPNCVSGSCLADSNNMLSPLQVAIQLGYVKIITLLLESKPKINQTDINGWTALHFAAYKGRTEFIDSLVNLGAELHKQNNDGSTPLHIAVKHNQCKTLETMLKAKRTKAINFFNNEMETPLHIACHHGCLTCVKILRENGADVNICTRKGPTPLDVAMMNRNTHIQQYLELP